MKLLIVEYRQHNISVANMALLK